MTEHRKTRGLMTVLAVLIAIGMLSLVATYTNGRAQQSASKADVERSQQLTQQVAALQELAKREAEAARTTSEVRTVSTCVRLEQLLHEVAPDVKPFGSCPSNPPLTPEPTATPGPSPVPS